MVGVAKRVTTLYFGLGAAMCGEMGITRKQRLIQKNWDNPQFFWIRRYLWTEMVTEELEFEVVFISLQLTLASHKSRECLELAKT